MAGDITFGVRLTGDNSGAVQALTLTRDELARLSQELGRTDRSMRDSARNAEEASDSFRAWAADTLDLKGALAGLTGALAAGAIVEGVGNTLNRLQDIQRTAQGLGISTKAVQELSYTFDQFNVASEDVTEGLAQLSGQALVALTGSTSLIDTWGQLGITVDQLRGKKPDQLFRLLAQGIAQTHDPVIRLASASSLLGEDLAGKLMPLLVQGAAGIDKFAGKANDLHVVLDDKLVGSAVDAAQSFKDVRAQINAEFAKTVAENAKELNALARALGYVERKAVEAAAGWASLFTNPDPKSFDDLVALQNKLIARRNFREHQGLNKTLTDKIVADLNRRIDAVSIQIGEAWERQQAATLPPVEVSGSKLPPSSPASPVKGDSLFGVIIGQAMGGWAKEQNEFFAPMDGFLAAVDKAHTDKFLGVDKLDQKLKGVADTSRQLQDMALQVGTGFADAFTNAVVGAESFGDSMKRLAADISKAILQAIILKSIQTGVNALFGVPAVPSADGNVFDQSGLVPFANGDIVTRPTIFPFANGTGLMGEAGPEAIMPLKRIGGKLGVQASGGAGVTVNAPITIHAPNADKQSVAEIAQITQRLPTMVAHIIVSDMHRDGPISRSIRR